MAHDITQRKLEETERLALIQELTAALARDASVRVDLPTDVTRQMDYQNSGCNNGTLSTK